MPLVQVKTCRIPVHSARRHILLGASGGDTSKATTRLPPSCLASGASLFCPRIRTGQ